MTSLSGAGLSELKRSWIIGTRIKITNIKKTKGKSLIGKSFVKQQNPTGRSFIFRSFNGIAAIYKCYLIIREKAQAKGNQCFSMMMMMDLVQSCCQTQERSQKYSAIFTKSERKGDSFAKNLEFSIALLNYFKLIRNLQLLLSIRKRM